MEPASAKALRQHEGGLKGHQGQNYGWGGGSGSTCEAYCSVPSTKGGRVGGKAGGAEKQEEEWEEKQEVEWEEQKEWKEE